MNAISIGYHDVVDERSAGDRACPRVSRYTLDVTEFKAHLRSIRQRAIHSSVCLIDGFPPMTQELPIFLTFDDGAIGSYTCVADELEKLNWKGHFFIVTDWIGRAGYVNGRQIRELQSRGHIIGTHSRSHPERMSHLNHQEQLKEWSVSCLVLGDVVGKQVTVASLPNGYFSREVGETAAAAGIQVLFNSEPRIGASIVNGCLLLGRYSIKAGMDSAVSGDIASGKIWPRWRQTAVWETMKAAKSVTGESYFTIRTFLLSRAMPKTSNRL
jgi:hypothetical protein